MEGNKEEEKGIVLKPPFGNFNSIPQMKAGIQHSGASLLFLLSQPLPIVQEN